MAWITCPQHCCNAQQEIQPRTSHDLLITRRHLAAGVLTTCNESLLHNSNHHLIATLPHCTAVVGNDSQL